MNKVDAGNLRKSTTVHQFKGANRIGSSIKDKTAPRTIAANPQATGEGKPNTLPPERSSPEAARESAATVRKLVGYTKACNHLPCLDLFGPSNR